MLVIYLEIYCLGIYFVIYFRNVFIRIYFVYLEFLFLFI